jgi:UDP-N-acetylglucosamine 2-epimerase
MLIQYWVAQRYEKKLTLPNYESINLRPTSKKTAKLPDENVSTKIVKLIQSYTGVVNKMVWRKF